MTSAEGFPEPAGYEAPYFTPHHLRGGAAGGYVPPAVPSPSSPHSYPFPVAYPPTSTPPQYFDQPPPALRGSEPEAAFDYSQHHHHHAHHGHHGHHAEAAYPPPHAHSNNHSHPIYPHHRFFGSPPDLPTGARHSPPPTAIDFAASSGDNNNSSSFAASNPSISPASSDGTTMFTSSSVVSRESKKLKSVNNGSSGVTNGGLNGILPGSNKKERRRTQSINNAFASLRDCIPNVPNDTKLSKIKTLRLATSYIDYLMNMLNTENMSGAPVFIEGFKADIHKKWNEKSEDEKRRELEAELNNNGGNMRLRSGSKGGARTGWPQHVWALELKQ